MPVLTDPRQIVEPLPASLIKEVIDGFPSGTSAKKRSTQTEREPRLAGHGAPTRRLEEKAGTGQDPICDSTGIRDQLWRHKVLVECWSLNASKEFRGELPAMSAADKELCQQEAILWAARERDRDKWMAFE